MQWPHAKDAILSKDFSLGSFGIFLICAFVLGYLVQAIGNIVESAVFGLTGGLPTNKVLKANSDLSSANPAFATG